MPQLKAPDEATTEKSASRNNNNNNNNNDVVGLNSIDYEIEELKEEDCKLQVAVRVRPLIERELKNGEKCKIGLNQSSIHLYIDLTHCVLHIDSIRLKDKQSVTLDDASFSKTVAATLGTSPSNNTGSGGNGHELQFNYDRVFNHDESQVNLVLELIGLIDDVQEA